MDVTLAGVSHFQDLVRQMDLENAQASRPHDHKKIITEVCVCACVCMGHTQSHTLKHTYTQNMCTQVEHSIGM